VGVVVAGVVVSSVIVGLLSSEGLSSRCLSLGVKILNLGLTEDARGCQINCTVLFGEDAYM